VPKYLAIIWYCVVAAMTAVFLYGLIFYIDAPIKPCGDLFCGKGGQPHTLAEYQSFRTWQGILIFTWAIGLPIHFVFSGLKLGWWRAEK